ncbi:MAG: hypothetical protein ACTSVK_02035 [Promethearchaeota archaeon]
MKIKQKNIELIPTLLLSSISLKKDVFNYLAPKLHLKARLKSSFGDISTIIDPEKSGFLVEKKSVPLKAIIIMKLTGKITSKIKLIEKKEGPKKLNKFLFEKDTYKLKYLIDDEKIKKREEFCEHICSQIPLYQLKFGVDYPKIGIKIKKIVKF